MTPEQDFRPSPIAGQWYPSDADQLARSVDAYIAAAGEPTLEGQVVAVMAPHAGHRYSGPVAGYAFATLRGLNPDLVVIVSPMHHLHHKPLLTSAHAAYVTPLGRILVNQGAVQELEAQLQVELGFGLAPVRNDMEHSLEIELPFLQRVLQGDWQLLPVMVRDVNPRILRALGKGLTNVLRDRQAILVASTDLSHFYPQNMAEVLDREVLRRVEAFDPAGVLKAEEEGKGFACGRGALAAVMWAAQDLGADKAHILNYATSGDVTGDFSQVVGYAAAVFVRSGNGEN